MKQLLVTGFEPFGGATHNPSAMAVRTLADEPGWTDVSWAVLPVTWADGPTHLARHAVTTGAHAALLFGLAGGATGLRLERCAYNLADYGLRDNHGVAGHGGPLVAHGPDVLQTSMDTRGLCEHLTAVGVPAVCSDDPGRFLCNAVYYHALADTERFGGRVLFVHLPATASSGGVLADRTVTAWVRATVKAYARITEAGTDT